MSSAEQLFLLADHVKLSLLERQRAQNLGLDGDSQDGHISRSLEQFRTGISSLEKEKDRLQQSGDERFVLTTLPLFVPRNGTAMWSARPPESEKANSEAHRDTAPLHRSTNLFHPSSSSSMI